VQLPRCFFAVAELLVSPRLKIISPMR